MTKEAIKRQLKYAKGAIVAGNNLSAIGHLRPASELVDEFEKEVIT